jgi:hypothetical protein
LRHSSDRSSIAANLGRGPPLSHYETQSTHQAPRFLIEDLEPLPGEQPHGYLFAVGLGGLGPQQGDWPLVSGTDDPAMLGLPVV